MQSAIECLTLGLSHGMNGVTLGINPLDMPITPHRVSEGKHAQQPTMPYHPTLASSSVHHLSHQWTVLFFLSYYNVT